MSFVLRGTARTLRFTGEVKAHAPKAAAHTGPLGKPRARRPTPADAAPSPIAAEPRRAPSLPGGLLLGTLTPGLDDSVSDEQPTMAMARDGADVLPGAVPRGRTSPPGAPIPHFRSTPPRAVSLPPRPRAAPRSESARGLPVVVWLVAAIVAGAVSYWVAPALVPLAEPSAMPSRR